MKQCVTIFHTSDVHGYVYSTSYATGEHVDYGLSNIKNLVKKNKNSLLIDTGDTIQGSALTYFHASMLKDETSPLADALNLLDYDYQTLGNHDFNYGQKYLNNYVKGLNSQLAVCNVYKNDKLFFDPYKIHQFENGIKVGLIGAVTQHIPNWENPENIKDLTFKNAFDAIKEYVSEVKPLVDAVVVMYHGGFEKDPITEVPGPNETGENLGFKIATEIDGIDVLLTGHQHQIISGKLNGVSYTQPGANGGYVGQVNLEFEEENGEWKLINNDASLIKTNYSPDQTYEDHFREVENKVQDWLDQVIGELEDGEILITDPLKDRLEKHPVVSFINQVQMDASGVDISCTALGNEVIGFNATITMRDLISTYVYPNTLVVLEMTGKLLKQLLEKNAEFFTSEKLISPQYLNPKKELYNYDMFDGIHYTIDTSKEYGNRITKLIYNGDDVKEDHSYQVVMNNYRAAGGGGFEFIKEAKIVKTIEVDIVEILANYIIKHKNVKIDHKPNITII
jgi:2',3'-cyclic-nucleotide 2'-phosphodiesterase/3'-nucleotidase